MIIIPTGTWTLVQLPPMESTDNFKPADPAGLKLPENCGVVTGDVAIHEETGILYVGPGGAHVKAPNLKEPVRLPPHTAWQPFSP